jgi:tetratricopeptide (TPR) repeat protein
MRSLILLIALLLGLTITAQDTSIEKGSLAFEAGNKAYLEEDYDTAIKAYQEVLAEGLHSKEVYLNLGNAYYKNGQTASSILYYEKGLLHFKQDVDLLTNLQFAENQRIDRIEPLPDSITKRVYKFLLSLMNAEGWAMTSLIFALLFAIAKTIKPRLRKVATPNLIVASMAFLTLLFIRKIERSENYAIVFEPAVTVLSDPKLDAPVAFELHEGTKVKPVESFEEFQKIEIANGQSGWIVTSSIRFIQE